MKPETQTPPIDTRWIMSRRDLPPNRNPARFEVHRGHEEPTTIILKNRKRQVLEALIRFPVYCASPVRLSDIVLLLRSEHDIGIETEFFADEEGAENTRFGIYVLTDRVRYLGEVSSLAESVKASLSERESEVAA